MMIDRRSLLKYAGLVPLMGAVPRLARAADEVANAEGGLHATHRNRARRAGARAHRLDHPL